MSYRTYINIKTQFENVGDALILRELIALIGARSDVRVDLSRCPQSFRAALAVDRIPRARECNSGVGLMLLSALRDRLAGRTIYYFLMPGGLTGEKSRKDFLAGMGNNLLLGLMSVAGVRICQVGVSYERIGRRYRSILRWRTRLMYSAMVRDEISIAYARSLGLAVTGLLPDLAFNLFRSEPKGLNRRGAIAFSFRVDKDNSARERLERYVLEICNLAPPDCDFYFVTQVARDRDFMLHLKSEVERTSGRACVYKEECKDIEACQRIYAECGFLFSNRLHGLLLALSARATPVAVVDPALDPKIVGVFDQVGLSGQVRSLASSTRDEQTASLFRSIDFDGSSYRRDLGRYFDDLYSSS